MGEKISAEGGKKLGELPIGNDGDEMDGMLFRGNELQNGREWLLTSQTFVLMVLNTHTARARASQSVSRKDLYHII